MVYFVGEHPRQLDDRGRFVLPAKIREKLEGMVYITKAPVDKCLNLYTVEEWEILSQKLRALPTSLDQNAAKLQRKIFGKACCGEVDKQGRLSITPELMALAGLKKDIMLVGMNTKLEIWDAEEWEKMDSDDDFVIDSIMKYEINI